MCFSRLLRKVVNYRTGILSPHPQGTVFLFINRWLQVKSRVHMMRDKKEFERILRKSYFIIDKKFSPCKTIIFQQSHCPSLARMTFLIRFRIEIAIYGSSSKINSHDTGSEPMPT